MRVKYYDKLKDELTYKDLEEICVDTYIKHGANLNEYQEQIVEAQKIIEANKLDCNAFEYISMCDKLKEVAHIEDPLEKREAILRKYMKK